MSLCSSVEGALGPGFACWGDEMLENFWSRIDLHVGKMEEKFVTCLTGQPGSDVSVSQRSSDDSSGTMMSNFLGGEKEVLCDETAHVNDDENCSRVVGNGKWFDFDTKVILTGNIDKHLGELDCWAKQLWGEVDSVNVAYNYINIYMSIQKIQLKNV